ncbi:hypothetical protein [Actinomadura violacea]|uniref:Uncharacterized protein n=1 Tax=Actinomadura violacea TaxID=2819934 RepID=A0ABS3RWJ4_9ACTN|nr:hypothetical protein [Actinomadura violacea]MBO2461137.1 hypothetical protein [Actinomadura violacea]
MSEVVDERDVRLNAHLPAAAEIICFVRDLDPHGVATWCQQQGITDRTAQELIVLLAAMVPDDQPINDLLAWTWAKPAPRGGCVVPMRRRCSCCGFELSLAAFWRDRSKPLERSYRCIDCMRTYREQGICRHRAQRRASG